MKESDIRPTFRQELAHRLRVWRKVYGGRPASYNMKLGMGRIRKENDRPFVGFSITGTRWRHDGRHWTSLSL